MNSFNYYILLAILTIPTIEGCDSPSIEETREKAQEGIGIDASLTATFVVAASNSCRIIGINDINSCSKISGILPDEKSAKMLADIAIDKAEKYQTKCQLQFNEQYCTQLANRAINIEWNKSKTINQGE